jgi:hypothetical protein
MAANLQIDEQVVAHAANVTAAARALLARQVNFLEGFRTLISLGYEPNGYDYAPGFGFLFWFNSVSAHLPDKNMRGRCTQEFLDKSDAEAMQLEELYGDRIDQACQELLDRLEKNV